MLFISYTSKAPLYNLLGNLYAAEYLSLLTYTSFKKKSGINTVNHKHMNNSEDWEVHMHIRGNANGSLLKRNHFLLILISRF